MARRFLVARNPDPDSTLPYLLYVPVGSGLVLKARDTWPRTSRVYCHRVEAWPEDAEILEEIPVLECRRRGVAVDLLLDRKREFRSQFVFTRISGGREGIFWQTRKVATTARPGARIPGRRISDLPGPLTILIDTREHYPYRFAKQQAETTREALPAGDYAVRDADGRIVAAVERKTIGDLAGSLNSGSLTFELAKLAGLPAPVLTRANEVLSALEKADGRPKPADLADDLPLFSTAKADPEPEQASRIEQAIAALNPDAMTPKEALEALYRLKALLDNEA